MPYFKELNILFVHIPKTGGTSVENYFYDIIKQKRTFKTIYCEKNALKFNNHSLQHCTYLELYEYKNYFDINFDNIKILSIVRNPYERLVSDLFYFDLINENMTNYEICVSINEFLNSEKEKYDNHCVPQYLYLVDDNNNINTNITIMRTESLNDDMKNNCYENFNKNNLCKNRNKINYMNLLNVDSINLINNFYNEDFKLFNYKKN